MKEAVVLSSWDLFGSYIGSWPWTVFLSSSFSVVLELGIAFVEGFLTCLFVIFRMMWATKCKPLHFTECHYIL